MANNLKIIKDPSGSGMSIQVVTKLMVKASDGSEHSFVEGYKQVMHLETPEWLFIQDENGLEIASFYKPVFWHWRDIPVGRPYKDPQSFY